MTVEMLRETDIPDTAVFTTAEVAKICKVAPRTVSKWFDSGRLKGYRIPGSQDRRIPRQRLISFLSEHRMLINPLNDIKIADQTTRAIDAAINMAAAMETIDEAGGDITTIGARIWNALDIRTREYLREIVPNA